MPLRRSLQIYFARDATNMSLLRRCKPRRVKNGSFPHIRIFNQPSQTHWYEIKKTTFLFGGQPKNFRQKKRGAECRSSPGIHSFRSASICVFCGQNAFPPVFTGKFRPRSHPLPLRVYSRKFASKSVVFRQLQKIFFAAGQNSDFRKITKPAWILVETAENSRFQLLSKKVCQAYHEIYFCPSLLKQWGDEK